MKSNIQFENLKTNFSVVMISTQKAPFCLKQEGSLHLNYERLIVSI